MNSFLNGKLRDENRVDADSIFLNNPTNRMDATSTKLQTADGDSTTSHFSNRCSWRRKSFADIVRVTAQTCDEHTKTDSCGDVKNGATSISTGQSFDSIENISVRSVLENLFKESCNLDNKVSGSTAPKFCPPETEPLSNGPTDFNANSSQHVGSVLKNIFHEDKIQTNEEAGHGNLLSFRYNLSDLLYERPRSAKSLVHPSTYFVCPRCGELTNLDTNAFEGLGSVGDRCLTNFRRFPKGQEAESNRRYIGGNQSASNWSWGGRYRSNFPPNGNPFSGLNQKKRNRYKEARNDF